MAGEDAQLSIFDYLSYSSSNQNMIYTVCNPKLRSFDGRVSLKNVYWLIE